MDDHVAKLMARGVISDRAAQRMMTHQAEQPNPAKPYVEGTKRAARVASEFIPGYGRGLSEVLKGAGLKLPDWSNRVGDVLQSEPANTAFGMTAPLKGIKAFHGSPHDFDRFDTSKIGTGEGAQSYGHGLYFAENESVAKSYRDALSGGNRLPGSPTGRSKYTVGGADVPQGMSGHRAMDTAIDLDGLLSYMDMMKKPAWEGAEKSYQQSIDYLRGNIERRIQQHGETPEQYRTGSAWRDMDDLATFYNEKVRNASPADVLEKPPGRMYEVNIKADPEHFLDWDRPLSEQPNKVVDAIADVAADRKIPMGNATGARAYNDLANAVGHQEATKALREAGVPGIRYLDQGSRAAGEGSRNYVVFDDKLIDIMKKYGLAGLSALPAMGAYHFQDQDLPQQ